VMSLVRLRQQQAALESRDTQHVTRAKLDEVHRLLLEIYHWFTEGFDTRDLQDASALLNELGGREEAQKVKTETEDQKQKVPFPSRLLSTLLPQAVQPVTASPHHISHATQDANTQSFVPTLPPPAAYTFRPEGEYWTMSFANTTCRLKDARGLHYIAQLLHHPHQEIHVLSLISTTADLSDEPPAGPQLQDSSLSCDPLEGFGDAGEILDPQARAAYKQRVRELQEELTEAQEFHDLGRSERLAAELDFLTHELSRAVGLGGRVRREGSAPERARVNVTRAIKIALRKIDEHHPALGQHLATTIKTGAYCSYTPDIRLPITWQC
jgi:hypothetical protein